MALRHAAHLLAPKFMHVGIIGAGLAGLACAIAATNAGADVQVFEASDGPAQVPAHVVIGSSMLRDLVSLGLGEACVRAGFPYQDTKVLDSAGREQFAIGTARLAGSAYPAQIGITHEALQQLLRKEAEAKGVRIHWNQPVCGLEEGPQGAGLRLANGSLVVVDLGVLASGTAPGLRGQRFPQTPTCVEFDSRWWYALIERPASLESAVVVFASAGHKAMMVPVGPRLAGLAVTVPAAFEARRSARPRAEDLRAAVREFPELVRKAAARLPDDANVVVRPVRGEWLPAPWHSGPFLCVGACAHALPPQFGQSAAQAVEDAAVLLALMHERPAALELAARFTERRSPRARRVYDAAIQSARWDVAPDGSTDFRSLAEQLAQIVALPA